MRVVPTFVFDPLSSDRPLLVRSTYSNTIQYYKGVASLRAGAIPPGSGHGLIRCAGTHKLIVAAADSPFGSHIQGMHQGSLMKLNRVVRVVFVSHSPGFSSVPFLYFALIDSCKIIRRDILGCSYCLCVDDL